MDLEIEEDDMSWIEEYLDLEKPFEKFYNKPVEYVNCFFIYIINRNIENINKNVLTITDSVITKEKILDIVNKNKHKMGKSYNLSGLVQYNFDIKTDDVNKFLINDSRENYQYMEYLKEYKQIEDIYWGETIPFFGKVNSLYFIYMFKRDCNGTKKIYLKNKDKKKNKNAKNAKNKTRKFRYYKDQLSVQKSNIKKIDSELLL